MAVNYKEKCIGLLSSTDVDMKTAQANDLYTVPTANYCYVTHLIVRDPTASMAGGTSYSVTNWKQTFSLATLTTANTDYIVIDNENTKYTRTAGDTTIQLTVTTGTTAACTATVDLFGYIA